MKAIKKMVYRADDGKLFDDKAECEKYEAKANERLKATTYWKVRHSPDLTEGRGWSGLTLIECYVAGWQFSYSRRLMEDWCYRTFGRPVEFVQDCSLMDNWVLYPSTMAEFNRTDGYAQVGDYKYPAKHLCLTLGQKDTGLVLDKETMGNRFKHKRKDIQQSNS